MKISRHQMIRRFEASAFDTLDVPAVSADVADCVSGAKSDFRVGAIPFPFGEHSRLSASARFERGTRQFGWRRSRYSGTAVDGSHGADIP